MRQSSCCSVYLQLTLLDFVAVLRLFPVVIVPVLFGKKGNKNLLGLESMHIIAKLKIILAFSLREENLFLPLSPRCAILEKHGGTEKKIGYILMYV
jgi:hypothetical protein